MKIAGGVVSFRKIVIVVTKKTETEIEKLQRENARLRGDLLSIGSRISHDLRTPLGSLLNTIELLREILAEKEPQTVAITDSLVKSVDEMVRLIKSMSLLTKATARPPHKKMVMMGEIVSGILQQLESRTLNKGVTVSAPDSWPEVEGVSAWLDFIWWNLFANAIEHGGLKIQLGWSREKNENRFWVGDNGDGVPVNFRVKLFQPFDSLHEPNSTRGVSLSIVQRLVELQGGRCGYEINSEGWPFFYFTLPLPDGK